MAALKDIPIRGRREASTLVQAAPHNGRWQMDKSTSTLSLGFNF